LPTVKQRPRRARSAAEERLRGGRVAVRGEQLGNFEKLLRASLSALSQAQEALARDARSGRRSFSETAGERVEHVRVLASTLGRGEEALSRHGLTEAV